MSDDGSRQQGPLDDALHAYCSGIPMRRGFRRRRVRHAGPGEIYVTQEEVFDDYGKPAADEERHIYRPERNEDDNPIRPDQGDDISSIVQDITTKRRT